MFDFPPDSGHWHQNMRTLEWEETNQPPTEEVDYQVRKNGFPIITVDGFPRQGNRFARSRILAGLPFCAMPHGLSHSQRVIEWSANNGHHVFHTLRSPIESISSYINMMIGYQKRPLDPTVHPNERIMYELKHCIYTNTDLELIEKCFAFYIRLTNLCIDLKEKTYIIPFEVIQTTTFSGFIDRIASAIGIDSPVNRNGDSMEQGDNPWSTADESLADYLRSSKFKAIRKTADEAHKKALLICRSI